MYMDGECGDYRWSYEESRAPTAAELLKYIHLMPGRAFTSAEASEAARAAGRDPSALLPHQAGMAMLPRAGRPYVPSPLRPLMDSEGAAGAVYDRDTCIESDCLRAQVTAVTQSLAKLRREAQEAGEVADAQQSMALRSFANRLHNDLTAHRKKMYPEGKIFPMDELLEAIEGVPLDAYPEEERPLLQHAEPRLFASTNANGIAAEDGAAGGGGDALPAPKLASEWARGLSEHTAFEAFELPPPPGERMQPLREPSRVRRAVRPMTARPMAARRGARGVAIAAAGGVHGGGGGSLTVVVRRGVSCVLASASRARGGGGGVRRALATLAAHAPRLMLR